MANTKVNNVIAVINTTAKKVEEFRNALEGYGVSIASVMAITPVSPITKAGIYRLSEMLGGAKEDFIVDGNTLVSPVKVAEASRLIYEFTAWGEEEGLLDQSLITLGSMLPSIQEDISWLTLWLKNAPTEPEKAEKVKKAEKAEKKTEKTKKAEKAEKATAKKKGGYMMPHFNDAALAQIAEEIKSCEGKTIGETATYLSKKYGKENYQVLYSLAKQKSYKKYFKNKFVLVDGKVHILNNDASDEKPAVVVVPDIEKVPLSEVETVKKPEVTPLTAEEAKKLLRDGSWELSSTITKEMSLADIKTLVTTRIACWKQHIVSDLGNTTKACCIALALRERPELDTNAIQAYILKEYGLTLTGGYIGTVRCGKSGYDACKYIRYAK